GLNTVLMRQYGFRLKIGVQGSGLKNVIVLMRTNFQDSSEYNLSVKKDVILLTGQQLGLFHCIQSLLQLLPEKNGAKINIKAVSIEDRPRFKYRGMHLDVSRHFMPVDFVKKYIDLMSQYKFNTFHWHLTDDQGWRIEIKKYPRLTEVGSKRPETVSGRVLQPYFGDGVPVEGFYTQEQIRDVVAYAKARYITVIPEIELPGHASAALEAYPQFGCKQDYTYKVQKTWGIFKEVFCPTDETFKFLEDVIDETIALFPDSPYVHIGGDEVLKDHWKESAFVQDLMKRENLKDEHEVQSYFIRRIEKHVNRRGKKIIGWDEILEGGLAPNATVMSWRGIKGGIEAAKAKHDVIMTPTDYAYLDYAQGDTNTEPINIGGYVPLEKVYGYDPIPKELTKDEAKYILGAQGNIWTEYMKTPDKVEYMGFPRILAMAEVGWSSLENKNFADFTRRLNANFARLDKQEVDYRIPEPSGLVNRVLATDEKAELDLSSSVPGAKVFYTIDGTAPDEKSTPYTKPLQVSVPMGERVDVKAIVVLLTGRKSSVYTATLLRQPWRAAEPEPKDKRPGVTYGLLSWRSDGVAEPFVTSGETRSLGFQQFAKASTLTKPFAVTFNGYFNAPADAIYDFQVESTYSAAIDIDGFTLIDDTGTPARKTRSAVVPLKAGLHKISLRYNNGGGEPFWRVRWALKGQNWRNLGGGELVH
ncbi:MAG: family 20 glycosylhydrolase, partial [Pyrinomonadaceae bacterium]